SMRRSVDRSHRWRRETRPALRVLRPASCVCSEAAPEIADKFFQPLRELRPGILFNYANDRAAHHYRLHLRAQFRYMLGFRDAEPHRQREVRYCAHVADQWSDG